MAFKSPQKKPYNTCSISSFGPNWLYQSVQFGVGIACNKLVEYYLGLPEYGTGVCILYCYSHFEIGNSNILERKN